MPRFVPAALLCAVLIPVAVPAGADLTPAGLWQQWQQTTTAAGGSLTAASVTESVGAITLSQPRLAGRYHGIPATVRMTEMRLERTWGRKLRIRIPGGQSFELDLRPEGREPITGTFPYSGSDLTFLVTGAPGALAYDLEPADIVIESPTPPPGGPAEAPAPSFLNVPDLTGHFTAGGSRLVAREATYGLAQSDPDSGIGTFHTGRETRPALTVETVAEPGPWQDATRITFTSEAAEHTLHTTAPDGSTTRRQVTRAGGTAALTVSPHQAGLRWHDSAFHLTMVPDAPDAPSYGVIAQAVDMDAVLPIAKAGPDQTATLGAVIDGLTLRPEDWAALDPEGKLPRDPGSVVLDLDAVLDLTAEPALPDFTLNFEFSSVQLHRLDVALAGATLAASGSFDFVPPPEDDGSGSRTPVGEGQATATGLTGLIGLLAEAGVLTPDQVAGLTMAMMMLAEPGEGDSFSSRVVFDADGALSVNGKPLASPTP